MPRYLTHFELRISKHPDTSILRTKRHILLSFSPLISPLVVSACAAKYLRFYLIVEWTFSFLRHPYKQSWELRRRYNLAILLAMSNSTSDSSVAITAELLDSLKVYREMQPYRYIIIASAGVCFRHPSRPLWHWPSCQAFGWELLSTLPANYKLLHRKKIRFTTIAYFISL